MKKPEYRVVTPDESFDNALDANRFAKEQSLRSGARVEVRRSTDLYRYGGEVLTQLYFKGKEYDSAEDIIESMDEIRKDNGEV